MVYAQGWNSARPSTGPRWLDITMRPAAPASRRGPLQAPGRSRPAGPSPFDYVGALVGVLVERSVQAAIDMASTLTVATAELQTAFRDIQGEVEERVLARRGAVPQPRGGRAQGRSRGQGLAGLGNGSAGFSNGASGYGNGAGSPVAGPEPVDVQEAADTLRTEVARARAEIRAFKRRQRELVA